MRKLFFALAIAISTIATANAQTKIAHVNSQKLLDTMPSRKAAIKDIQAYEYIATKELRALDSVIRIEYMDYEKNQPTWSETVRKYKQESIQRKQAELEQRGQQVDQDLQAMTQQMNVVILDKVKKAVNTVATAKKVNYVIDETSVLFSSGGIDITNEVITELLKLDAATTPKTPQ